MNDEEAYTWFFRAEYTPVVRTSYLVTRDMGAAEDAAQEAFIQLLRHWKKVSRYEQPDAWVRRVALRIAVRKAKRDARWARLEVAEGPPPSGDANDSDLAELLRGLPPQQRAAAVLFYYEDRPISEIAPILGCSESTVKVHLHKARKALSRLLGEEAADVG